MKTPMEIRELDGPRAPLKKSYNLPHLSAFGTLVQLTETFGKSGHPDGGTNQNGKNFTQS